MTRRELLLAMSASACGGAPTDPLRDPTGRTEPGVHVDPVPGAGQLNVDPSPLVFRDDGAVLVQSARGELWTWDAVAMRRLDQFSVGHRAFGVLADGAIAALAVRETDCAVHRITIDGTIDTFATALCGGMSTGDTLVLRTEAADSIYIAGKRNLDRFRLAGGVQLDLVSHRPLPTANASNRGQMFSLGDGRVVVPARNGLHVLSTDAPTRVLATPDRFPLHLSRATKDRLWYSHAIGAPGPTANGLTLAGLDDPGVAVRTIDLSPARIIHMASHGETVAVLLETSASAWTVAVYDEAGSARWRAALPDGTAAVINSVGAVAISARRVVLRGIEDTLFAWDAETGAPIAVARPT